jgi:far upstream element-binding protein
VPNECVGLVIGKEGETIKNIAKKSGALKVQVATTSAPGSKSRNVFVEGDADSVERVRKELNAIIETQRKMNSGAVSGSYKIEVEVPVRLIGLVIGRGGETIKGINTKTGAFVCLSKDEIHDKARKILTITGPEDLCLIAKYEIDQIVQNGLKNLQKQGGLNSIEMEMIKPITPISQQLAELNLPIPTSVQTIR